MERIYLASDLAQKRREVIDEARSDFAQIRDTDGTSLVMLEQRRFDFLRGMLGLVAKWVRLDLALSRPFAERHSTDFGEFAWLESFDQDDQETFHSELLEAINLAVANSDLAPIKTCIDDWQRTARALSNEKVKRALTAAGDDDYAEVKRPA
jgi:hypothetical protein